jgi:hypothetical protein
MAIGRRPYLPALTLMAGLLLVCGSAWAAATVAFAPAKHYPAGDYSPQAVSAVDFDGDGDTDIATANYGSDNVSVLANRGDGTFGPNGSARIFGVGEGPADVTRAPMKSDRRPDLITANDSGNFYYPDDVSVLLNTTQ